VGDYKAIANIGKFEITDKKVDVTSTTTITTTTTTTITKPFGITV
jgi:hypothetical protein